MAGSPQRSVDLGAIGARFAASRHEYESAKPFPHIALTGLFDRDLLRQVAAEFPQPATMAGQFAGEIEGGKFTESNWSRFGPATQQLVAACNSGPFLEALTALTGIKLLISDPYLTGGGLHQSGRGARLKVHSDFNVHPFLKLTRRLNLLVYLNENWNTAWGGNLDLWNADMSAAVVSIPPQLGQVAIFTCSDESFHGLPDPLSCPDGVYRKSVAFYYFTSDDKVPDARSTLWKERTGEDFLSRPRMRLRASAGHARRAVYALLNRQPNG
jgi:Rps23 Pro-64 3,4-dihydroxylase Tpa1-like proline 4-hydroxylase